MEPLETRFGLSPADFGAMASMYFYAYCIAQIPTGVLADSIGVRLTSGLSLIFAAAATIVFGFASSATVLYASRFAVGIGVAACFVCVMKAQAQWFQEREFSTLSGICLFGGNLGSLCGQAPLALLVAALSFEDAFFSIGVATLVLGLLCLVFVRNKPEDLNAPQAQCRAVSKRGERFSLAQFLYYVLRNKHIGIMFLYYFLLVPQFLAFAGTWSVSYIRGMYNLSLPQASNIASIQVVCFMLGSLLIGFLSDKVGKRKPFILIPTFVIMLVWVLLACCNSSLSLTAFAVCLGGIGFFSAAFSPMMAMCKEVSPRESTGTAIALLNTFGFLGIAIATHVYGIIVDRYLIESFAVSHGKAFLFLAAMTCLGFLAAFGMKETNGRNIVGPSMD